MTLTHLTPTKQNSLDFHFHHLKSPLTHSIEICIDKIMPHVLLKFPKVIQCNPAPCPTACASLDLKLAKIVEHFSWRKTTENLGRWWSNCFNISSMNSNDYVLGRFTVGLVSSPFYESTSGISYSWNFKWQIDCPNHRVAFCELVMTTSVTFHPLPMVQRKMRQNCKGTVLVDESLFRVHDCIGGQLCLITSWTQPWWYI